MKEKLLKLLFAFLACCSSAAHAADGESAEILVLKFADARTVKFLLADKPEINFADGKLMVMSEKVCKILLVLSPMLGKPKHGENL